MTASEDIVQDATALGRSDEIESPKVFLSATTTRLAIDHLRPARMRREKYVGE